MTHPILSALGLADTNFGTFLGGDEWSKTTDAGVLEPLNPATNEPLAKVYATSDAEYETIVRNAQKAFAEWRNVPAPKRGEAVRLCARALREHKDALGSLVALEMGKIKPEGDGEVQEMIDIADFAVGQSRMLYGLSMHSERPGHRMYEQWHPLGLAIPAIVFGAVGTAGQRCTSTRRLFVHESIIDDVLGKLRHAYQQVEKKIGDPTKPETLMGPLNSKAAVDQFANAVKTAKASGARVVSGGSVLDRKGNFVEPTIISGVQSSDEIVQTETFAPILYVMPFKSLDDAIRMQNDVPQGLSSAIFTQNLKAAEQYLSALGSDCGIANVNIGTSGAEIGGAFGGEKETGGGRESGSDAWKAYMRRQTNTINWSDALPLAQGIKFDL
jgi:acyl-CoA reductase-like NAD-dependent aldehyde dehydrogenase